MTLIIRTARADEVDLIADLHLSSRRAAYGSLLPPGALDGIDGAENRARLRERVGREAGTHRLAVASAGPAIVGFTYAGPGEDGDSGELHNIHVAPAHLGTGAGKALMADVLAWFSASGWPLARLWVLRGNTTAIDFYERGGWRAAGTVREELMGTALVTALRYSRDLA